MDANTKKKITNIVLAYKELFAWEYKQAVKQNKMRADMQLTPWGEVPDNSAIGREVLRIPENLEIALNTKLEPEQYNWLFKDMPGGTTWFGRRFPEFVPNNKID